MKRALFVVLLAVLALVALGPLGLSPAPWGELQDTQICSDCGMTRSSRSFWLGSRSLAWEVEVGIHQLTPVSRFLEKAGDPRPSCHVWRFYRGVQRFQGCLKVVWSGPHEGEAAAHTVLPQEETLVKLDPGLAVEVVKARLFFPILDGLPSGTLPGWFKARGWPPRGAEEARAWWAANKP